MAGFSLARDFITKGLYDRAQAEIARVLARGGDKILGLVLAGDAFATQGLHGEGLERYRRALEHGGYEHFARQGIARSLLALGARERGRCGLSCQRAAPMSSPSVGSEARSRRSTIRARGNPRALEKNESRNANVMKRGGRSLRRPGRC